MPLCPYFSLSPLPGYYIFYEHLSKRERAQKSQPYTVIKWVTFWAFSLFFRERHFIETEISSEPGMHIPSPPSPSAQQPVRLGLAGSEHVSAAEACWKERPHISWSPTLRGWFSGNDEAKEVWNSLALSRFWNPEHLWGVCSSVQLHLLAAGYQATSHPESTAAHTSVWGGFRACLFPRRDSSARFLKFCLRFCSLPPSHPPILN